MTEEHELIVEEIRDSVIMERKAAKRLLGRLETIRKHYQVKHDNIVEQRRTRMTHLLGDYHTVEEAHEAYGYDCISEDEYRQIVEFIEKGQQAVEADTEEKIMIDWLNMWIHALNYEINELTYQLMTPEEKASHDKSVQEWKDNVEELRKKYGR